MIPELQARLINKERLANAEAVGCPREYCANEYRSYIVGKEKQY